MKCATNTSIAGHPGPSGRKWHILLFYLSTFTTTVTERKEQWEMRCMYTVKIKGTVMYTTYKGTLTYLTG